MNLTQKVVWRIIAIYIICTCFSIILFLSGVKSFWLFALPGIPLSALAALYGYALRGIDIIEIIYERWLE